MIFTRIFGSYLQRRRLRTLLARALLLLAAVGVVLLLLGSTVRAEAPKLRISIPAVRDYRLANGLRVVTQRTGVQPLVSVVLAYKTGSRDDPQGYSQLAHVVEHMTFRGSRHLKSYEMMDQLERASVVDTNAVTTPDTTFYYAVLPSAQLALPLWLESERMAFTLEHFNAESLKQEIATVKLELLERESRSYLNDHIDSVLFGPDHPYREPISQAEDLDSIDLGATQWFFQQGYRPDNATLIVTGMFNEQTLLALVQRYFGPVRNPPWKFERRGAKRRQFKRQERLSVTEMGGVERYLHFVFPACKSNDPDAVALKALSAYLAEDLAPSLEASGLAFDLSSAVSHQELFDRVDLQMTLGKRAEFEPLVQEVRKHLDRLGKVPLDSEAVALLTEELLSQLLGDIEDPFTLGLRHMKQLHTSGEPLQIGREIQRISALNGEILARVARKYLDPKHNLVATRKGTTEFAPPGGWVSYEEAQ